MKIAELTATVSVDGVPRANAQLDAFGDKITGVSKAAEGLGTALGVAGAAYGAYSLGRSALDAAAKMESLQIALKANTGSTKEFGQVTRDLAEISKLPSINLEQAYMGFVQLRSAKFGVKEAEQALIGMAKAATAASAGPEQLGRAMVGLQQLANSPKPLQEEINQLRENLSNASSIMDKAFGTSRAEDLQTLGLTGKQVAMGFIAAASALPQMAGGIGNMMVNLEDSTRALNVAVGGLVAKFLEAFGPTIQEAVGRLTVYFDSLAKNQDQVQTVLKTVVGALAFGAIVTGINNVIKLVNAFREVLAVLKAISVTEILAMAILDPKRALAGAAAGLGIVGGVGFGMNALFAKLFPSNPLPTLPPSLPETGGAQPTTTGAIMATAEKATKQAKGLNSGGRILQAIVDAIKMEQKQNRSAMRLDQIEANTRSAAESLQLDRRITGGGAIAQMGATASEIRAANMSAGSGYGVSSNAIMGGNYIERHIRRTVMDEIRRSGGYAIPRG